MSFRVLVYSEVVVMSVMPGLVRGPLAGAVMGRLSEWLAAECYANSTVAQILGVARGLSVWMDDHDVTRAALIVGVLDAFEADYGLGVAGHVIVGMRLPAIRRFLTEAGFLTGAVIPRKRVRRRFTPALETCQNSGVPRSPIR